MTDSVQYCKIHLDHPVLRLNVISLILLRNAPPDVSWLPIDTTFLKQLWLPNVYVYDLVSFNPLECLEKLAGLWVVEKKEIFYNLVR